MTREEAKELKDKIYNVSFDYEGDDLIDKIYDDFENEKAEWENERAKKETYDCIKEVKCEINNQGFCDDEIICGCEGCRFYRVIYVPVDNETKHD